MRIRAAVLDRMGVEAPYAKSKPLRIAELELDPPGRNEVLVRVGAAGMCHSDLSVINGDRPRPMPMALGHESAGIVEALKGGDVREVPLVVRLTGTNAEEGRAILADAGFVPVETMDEGAARAVALANGAT